MAAYHPSRSPSASESDSEFSDPDTIPPVPQSTTKNYQTPVKASIRRRYAPITPRATPNTNSPPRKRISIPHAQPPRTTTLQYLIPIILILITATLLLYTTWPPRLCDLPGMGPCLQTKEHLKEWGRNINEDVISPLAEKRERRDRGVTKLNGDEDFGSIVVRIVGSLGDDQGDGIVRDLIRGRDEVSRALGVLSDAVSVEEGDKLKDLRAQFKGASNTGISALHHHKTSIAKLIDSSISYNAQAIKRLENVQSYGPGKLLTWSDRLSNFLGGKKTDDNVTLEKKVQAEVQTLNLFLEDLVKHVAQSVDLQVVDMEKLRSSFLGIASALMKDDVDVENFEHARYWKKALKKISKETLDFDRIAVEFVNAWTAIEDSMFMVLDNLNRLSGAARALEKLKDDIKEGVVVDEEGVGDYIAVLKTAGRLLEKARNDTSKTAGKD